MEKIEVFMARSFALLVGIVLAMGSVVLTLGAANEQARRSEAALISRSWEITEATHNIRLKEADGVGSFYDVPLSADVKAYIETLCLQNEIRPELLYAMIAVESGYRTDKVSPDGSKLGRVKSYAQICLQSL